MCRILQASGRDKFTFELKWFIPLPEIVVVEEESAGGGEARETSPANIVALKSQASTVRDQILADERAAHDDKVSRPMRTRTCGTHLRTCIRSQPRTLTLTKQQ